MYNKKVLSTATKNLNKVKAPAKPKDQVISKPVVSTQGYKQGPPPEGTHYRIPGNDGTTSIYNPTPYPLNLVGPNGTQAQIGPWDTTTQHFNEPYIDEFPVAAKGGSLPNIPKKKNSKGYSRSLMATNKLFAQNPLTKKPKSKKRKIFDPNSKYYQDGGARDIIWNQNLAKDDKEFQDWYWNNSQALEAASGTPYSEDFAYDYYSYFKNKDHLDTQGNPVDHYIDKYKRPQHPRFSDESLYSTPENPGGHWEIIDGEEVLIPYQGLSLTKRNKRLGGLIKAQEGYENKPAGKFEGEDYYNALTMANQNLQEVKVKPKSEQLSPVSWVRFQREFQNANPYDAFARERREKYLKRTNKGLNELAGVTEENFPKAAEKRIRNAYERKMTTYMAKRLADTMGFDPNKRGEWVDKLKAGVAQGDPQAEKWLEIFSKSDYQSKLPKSLGSRMLSGLQETGNLAFNASLPGGPGTMGAVAGMTGESPVLRPFDFEIEGYTPEERKEAKGNPLEALEVFSWTEALPQIALNALDSQGSIAGTEGRFMPGILSGEIKPHLEDKVALVDPTNYMLGYKAGLTGLRNLGKAARYTRKAAPIVWSRIKDAARASKNFTTDAARATGDWLDTPLLQPKSFKRYQNLYNTQLANSNNWRELAMGNLTPLQSLSRPSMLLKTATVGTTAYNVPKLIEQNNTNLNILTDESIDPAERLNAGSNLLLNNFSIAFGLSPIFGRMGNYAYNSNPSQVTSIVSNAKKLYDSDPEGFRTWFNTARLLTALPRKQEGGQTSWEGEYTDEELEQLKRDGYQIEYLD